MKSQTAIDSDLERLKAEISKVNDGSAEKK